MLKCCEITTCICLPSFDNLHQSHAAIAQYCQILTQIKSLVVATAACTSLLQHDTLCALHVQSHYLSTVNYQNTRLMWPLLSTSCEEPDVAMVACKHDGMQAWWHASMVACKHDVMQPGLQLATASVIELPFTHPLCRAISLVRCLVAPVLQSANTS